MVRFIICEDNKEFLTRIHNILTKVMMPYNFEYKINEFTEYNKEVHELIKKEGEEKVYILDIELGEVSGLEIASEIREEDLDSVILFVTNHGECKNDIFYSRLLAIDFIPKDKLWPDRLEETIRYIIKTINKKKVLIYNFNRNSYRIPFDNILYIEKLQEVSKCVIVTESGEKFETNLSIQELSERLGRSFFQCHKSCIVNVEKIKRINYSENTITFLNNKTVYLLSNRKKKELKTYVANY